MTPAKAQVQAQATTERHCRHQSLEAQEPRLGGVTRYATSCNDRSNFMRHRVRNRASEWKRLGASEQVVHWIRRWVNIFFIGSRQPPPFNIGTSMLDATQQKLHFMDSELPKFRLSCA
jgi:hypothetical protein